MTVQFTVDPHLASIIRAGVLWFDGATVVEHDHRLDAPLAAAEAAVRMNPPAETTAVRTMYKRVGIDPTKTRPSSEALLRRVRKGDPLPRINSMVDVCNWCSFEFQLPYGLYDAAKIQGDVMLRIGRDGESYPGIRKDDVHVTGGIALVDRSGTVPHPTSDWQRTMGDVDDARSARSCSRARVGHGALDARHGRDVGRMQQYTGSVR
jgi:DNA/RNA-binding domain of Phe-tRNA-synthetase-like protein